MWEVIQRHFCFSKWALFVSGDQGIWHMNGYLVKPLSRTFFWSSQFILVAVYPVPGPVAWLSPKNNACTPLAGALISNEVEIKICNIHFDTHIPRARTWGRCPPYISGSTLTSSSRNVIKPSLYFDQQRQDALAEVTSIWANTSNIVYGLEGAHRYVRNRYQFEAIRNTWTLSTLTHA